MCSMYVSNNMQNILFKIAHLYNGCLTGSPDNQNLVQKQHLDRAAFVAAPSAFISRGSTVCQQICKKISKTI